MERRDGRRHPVLPCGSRWRRLRGFLRLQTLRVRRENRALLWSATTGAELVSSPAVANGVVYIGSYDSKLYAFNARTGALLWSAATNDAIQSSPAVANRIVYVGTLGSTLYAFRARDGAPVWKAMTGAQLVSAPAVTDGTVYVGSDDFKLLAFFPVVAASRGSHGPAYRPASQASRATSHCSTRDVQSTSWSSGSCSSLSWQSRCGLGSGGHGDWSPFTICNDVRTIACRRLSELSSSAVMPPG